MSKKLLVLTVSNLLKIVSIKTNKSNSHSKSHSLVIINSNKQSLTLKATMSQKISTEKKTVELILATNLKMSKVTLKTLRESLEAALLMSSAKNRGQNVKKSLCHRVRKYTQSRSKNSSLSMSYEGQNNLMYLKGFQF